MRKKTLGVIMALSLAISTCLMGACGSNSSNNGDVGSVSVSEGEISGSSLSDEELAALEVTSPNGSQTETGEAEGNGNSVSGPVADPYEEVAFTDNCDVTKYYATAYRKFLLNHYYEYMNYYYWQFGSEESEWWPYHRALKERSYIAILDVTGDDKPEFITVSADSYDSSVAAIRIYTSIENEMDPLFEEYVDGMVEGGCDYVLFKNGLGELYLFTVDYGVTTRYCFRKLGIDESGYFATESLVAKYDTYDYETDTTYSAYSIDDGDATAEAYEKAVVNIVRGTVHALLYDGIIDQESFEWVKNATRHALTFGEAYNKLTVCTDAKEGEFPFEGSLAMSFASGAGGWSTELSLYSNGTFYADFHDSDMGDCGDGYQNGTVYIGTAEGRFTDIKKIDDYTYSCKLVEFENSPITDPYIEDEFLYVPSETYGIELGDYIMYLPGKDTSDIPEEVLWWGSAFVGDIMSFGKLPLFTIYNVETMEAFYN